MANFTPLIPIVKKWEGGLSKDPNDTASAFPVPDGSGYHTNKGITWKTFELFAKKYGYVATPKLFYEMPDSVWVAIFKGQFWDVVGGDKIKSTGVAFFLMDWGWNSGPNTAVMQLQQVLNRNYKLGLKVDGVMGTNTIANTNAVEPTKILALLKQERIDFYNQIVKNNPSQSKWLKGWLNRTNDMFEFASKNILPVGGSIVGALLFFLERLSFTNI
jgi:lysozyme family protein